jgi:predicted dehydrogenase
MGHNNTVSEKTLQLAFIGTGWIGRNRMEAILKTGLAAPLIISDSNPSVLEEIRKQYPDSEVTTNIKYNRNLDGVVIATPSALHSEQAVEALSFGLPVFCQKPLARTVSETELVVNTAKEKNLFLGVDYSYRYAAAFRKVYEIVRSGEIGDVFAADLVFHNAYGPDKYWSYMPELSGGGCLIDLGIHLVDLLLYTLDFPGIISADGKLYAKGSLIKEEMVVEDFATARILLDNDITAQLTCSWNISEIQDANIRVAFYGSKGTAVFRNINGSFYDFNAELYIGRKREVLVGPPDDWMGRGAAEWVTRLSSDSSYDNSAENFIETAKIIDMIYGRYEL